MIELRTLGAVDLRGASGDADVDALRSRPKAVALLVYLAFASREGPVRRDTLLGLFWPELSEERARRALSQSLYSLRRTLGKDLVEGSGDGDLRVRTDRLACDACVFLAAVEDGRRREATASYTGEFLNGFHLPGCPGFDRWAEGWRRQLRRSAARAALGLAEEAAGDGDAMEVALAVRWALARAPHDEGVLREGLGLLDRVGNRAAALDSYDVFAARLREDLEVEPSPETEAFVEELRGRTLGTPSDSARGSRDVEDARSSWDASGPAFGPSAAAGPSDGASPPNVARETRRRALALWGTAAAIVTIGLGLTLWQPWVERTAVEPEGTAADGSIMAVPADERPEIAVLPLESLSASEEDAYLAAGLHEELLRRLSLVRSLAVISRTSVLRYADTDMGAREIAADLGVRYVMEGTVQQDGERVRVHVQLIDAATDRHVWAERFDRTLDDLFALQSEIAESTARELEAVITPEERTRIEARPTEDPIAYDLYLRATDLGVSVKEEYDASVELLRRATRRDPGFALAHARLAQWYFAGATIHLYPPLDSALARADKAVELDPALPEGHALRGWLLGNRGHDEEARAALQRAVALNPSLGLAWAGLTAVGHWSGDPVGGALAGRRGASVDPNDPIQALHLGIALMFTGMYGEAIQWYQRHLDLLPDGVWALALLMHTAVSSGDLESAWQYARRMRQSGADNPTALFHASFPALVEDDLEAAERILRGIDPALQAELNLQSTPTALGLSRWIQARLGRAESREGLQELRRFREDQLAEFPLSRGVRADLMLVASALGDPDATLHWFLETVRLDGTGFLYFLRDYPWLDAIRDRPEFQGWLRDSEERMAVQRRELEAIGGWTPEEVLGGGAGEASR